ncbi:MAG: ATP-binding protein [Roseimicrobium sp.]
MSSSLRVTPFDSGRLIGSVCEAGPSYVKANLPRAAKDSPSLRFGERMAGGQVGEFVFIECAAFAVFGRITSVKLPERDRLAVEVELGKSHEAHPVGSIQLLATLDLDSGRVICGIAEHPRLGSFIYSAPPQLVAHVAERFGSQADSEAKVKLHIGSLPAGNQLPIEVTPERVFGRHCAVLGTTGGGKSYTLARLMTECAKHNSRIILLDATGEYHTLGDLAEHFYLGSPAKKPAVGSEVVLPYEELSELDLYALFQPSGKTQAPKLRDAIRSLKLVRANPALADNGLLLKAEKAKAPIIEAMKKHAAAVNDPRAKFEIEKLAEQIQCECVFPIGKIKQPPKWTDDPSKFGEESGEMTYCVTLVSRINAMIQSEALAPILRPRAKPSLFPIIDSFLTQNAKPILRVSLEFVQFDYNARELIANAIGRDLIRRARAGAFADAPLLVFLDEAHQFLNRSLGDEDTAHRLDAFDVIAKEGRKYGLAICMATQRPRDIPDGVLSQMGTLIVHRLINDKDREVVERAAGEIDRAAAAFLPTLSPGEAAVVGVDFPIPLTVQIAKPPEKHWPKSEGPNFQKTWSAKRNDTPLTSQAPKAAPATIKPEPEVEDDEIPF